jgi:hypothetical protein
MRQLFNADRYVERAAAGELFDEPFWSRPAPTAANEPPGTLSQRLRYRDANGTVFAVAHRYLRPDGSIGGRGRPDPKILFTPTGRLDVDPNHGDIRGVCPDCV